MIAFFPELHPDQLLFDAIGKYQEQANYSNSQTVAKRLFGSVYANASMDFPTKLGYLVANLPLGHQITVSKLINDHTLLPYYAPFQPAHVITQVCQDMENGGGQRIHTRLGIKRSCVMMPTRLRLCPSCIESDQQSYGTYYWHRVHQVPGVFVCPHHQVFLEDSDVPAYDRSSFFRYYSATSACIERNLITDLAKWDHSQLEILTTLAKESLWLLNNPPVAGALDTIRQKYIHALAQRDLVTLSGRIRKGELQVAFNSFYSPQFLTQIGCPLDYENPHNWLYRLIRNTSKAQHPLCHLLLICFLNHTVESFWQLPDQHDFFGSGPWPCLNKVCPDYGRMVISSVKISSSNSRQPTGSFQCECGFTYVRRRSEQQVDDIYKRQHIVAFGSIWKTYLRDNWTNPHLSLRELARTLGVDPHTVIYQGRRMNLPFPRPGQRGGKGGECQLPESRSEKYKKQKQKHRSLWTAAIRKHPDLNYSEIKSMLPATYDWLCSRDEAWLSANRPVSVRKTPVTNVDWNCRDLALLPRCLNSIMTLLRQRKPVRLTATSIAKGTGQLPLIQSQKNKLPRTSDLIACFVESRLDFAIRRIWYAADLMKKSSSSQSPRRWKLVRQSGTGFVDKIPQVDTILHNALDFIEERQNDHLFAEANSHPLTANAWYLAHMIRNPTFLKNKGGRNNHATPFSS